MAYAIKYLFKFESSNGTTREIRVLQDGYTGEVIQRPLGRAPILKKQQNGPVHGTSLEFFAECNVDREFIEFYTSDPKAYRVDLYAGSTLLWQGYITPELYSEPDIAPPYDVQVVATDGVGELKLYDYAAQGAVTLRTLLSGLLSRTGLGTDIYLISSLKPGSAGAGSLLEKTINLDYMAGQTCYEVLTYILDTLHATITWWKGAWILTRETNVTFTNGKVRYFNTAGNSALLNDSVQVLGKMYTNPAWPVGQLSTVIDPAKNKIEVQAPWHPVTCLQNPNMTSDASWTKINSASYDSTNGGYLLPFPQGGTGQIRQQISMAGLRVPMSISVRATASTSTISGQVVAPQLGVLLIYTVGNASYHLRKGSDGAPVWESGALPSGAIPAGTQVDFQQTLSIWDASRIEAEELKVENIPAFMQGGAFPAGTMTVYIIGYCATVFSAHLDVTLPKGYADILHIGNGARGEGNTVEIAIGRETTDNAYYAAFLQGLLLDSGSLITSFSDANFTTGMDYLAFIARDYALSVALPRAKVTGTVFLEGSVQIPPLVFTKGGLDYWVETWGWNLYEDELEISARTLPSASLTVQSETILESNGSTVSSAGGAGSSGSGSSMGGGGGTNYWEIDGTLNTLLKPKDAYAYVHSKDGLFFTGATLSGTVVPDLYVDTVNNQRVLRSPLPLITGGDQIVIDGTPGGGGGGGGATTLAGLDDTNITNPQAGQMLSWNGTKWVNTNAPTGSITSVALAAGAANGTLHLVVNGTAQSDVAVTGLKALAYKDSLAFSEITGTASASQIPTIAISKISGLQTALDGKQPLDADLTAIAGLTGTSGFLKKTAANTWALDTNTYLTSITSTMVTNALGYTPANSTALANYLPLAGGTLTNSEREILKLNQETTSTGIVGPYIRFSLNNGIRAGVGYNSSIGAFIENYFTVDGVGSNAYVNLDNLGVLKHNNTQPYLHTGNYSSYLDSVYHPYGGGNIAFQTSTLAASGQVTISGTWGIGVAGLVISNYSQGLYPWIIKGLAPNLAEGAIGGSIIFGKADSSYNSGTLYFCYAGSGSTSNYVGIGLFNKDDLLKVYGTGVTEVKSLKIGSATITWNSNGYLHIDQPLVTAGDQIVISGTPGGGGGGGATSLWGLDDVSVPHGSTTPSNGQVLTWNSTLAKWTNQSITSGVSSVVGQTGAVTTAQIATALTGAGYKLTDTTYSAGTGLTLNGTQFSVTANTYAPYNANGYLPLTGGTLKNSTREILTLNQETRSTGETGAYIRFSTNGASKAGVGYNSNLGTFIENASVAGAPYVNIDNSGEFKYKNTYTFLHSGNYTDYVNTTNFPGLNGNQTITLSGDVSGSGATSISVSIGQGKVTNSMLAGSIANGKLANSSITINGSSTSLGGSFSTASITAGTAGQSTASSGVSFSVPYVTMNAYGIVTGYGTHTHSISAQNLYDTIGDTKYAPYHAAGYVKKDADTMTSSARDILTLNQNTTSTGVVGPYIAFHVNGVSVAGVGSNSSIGAYLGNDNANEHPYVNLDNNGVFKYNNTHSFWHAGNSNLSTVNWAANQITANVGKFTTSTDKQVLIEGGQSGANIAFYSTAFHAGSINAAPLILNNQSGGNVGIGTASPNTLLHVSGTTIHPLRLQSTASECSMVFAPSGNTGTNGTHAMGSYMNGTAPAFFIYDSTLNTQAIHIEGGKIGLWTTSPTAKLTVMNAADPGSAGHTIAEFLSYSPNPYGLVFRGFASGAHAIQVEREGTSSEFFPLALQHRGGNVGIGTTTPSQKLYVVGNIASTGDQVVSSDLTLKENLTPVTYSVSDIAKARAVEFDWRDGRGHSMGSIAQDWLGIAPALVHGEEGNMSLAYGQLALVNTILLARQSESHEERIKELEARVAELEMENERLRMN